MNPYFFLRFSLQRMGGNLNDDQFDSCDKIKLSKKKIELFLLSCNEKQKSAAEEIYERYSKKINILKDKKVLFVGDSLTADRLGYRGIVTKAAGLNSKNASYSGATSADMYRYLYGHIEDFGPHIIYIMIGTNDSFRICGKNGESIVSKSEYSRNVREILKISQKSGARVVISTFPQIDEEVFLKTDNAKINYNDNMNIAMYNKIVKKEAKAAGVELIDIENALKKMSPKGIYEPDGIHLSIDGQKKLADLWIKNILK